VTIVVTGASGFVGTALVGGLSSAGVTTVAVSGPQSQQSEIGKSVSWLPFNNDVDDLVRQISALRPRAVVHCATHYVRTHNASDLKLMFDANLVLGTHLLEAFSEVGTHFVNLSSYFQHQRTESGGATSLYAVSKAAFLTIAYWYNENTSISTSDLTLFDTYGPGDKRKKLISTLLACAQSGETTRLHSASAVVDLCYVDDVVSAILGVLTDQLVGSWSIRSNQLSSVAEIAQIVEEVTGRRVISGDANHTEIPTLSTETPPMLPGWRPTIGLHEGISRCWKAMQAGAR